MRAAAWSGLGQSIWRGDALSELREMDDESVQAIVTSPPYFGLRSYQTEPVVWDDTGGCEHAWGEPTRRAATGGPPESMRLGGGRAPTHMAAKHVASSAVCARCGAMRCELGAEPDPASYVRHLVAIFREAKRVLRADGILWCVIADSYATRWGSRRDEGRAGLVENGRGRGGAVPEGLREKSLCLVPERLAIALSDDGWTIRSRIAWVKQAPMPESVRDRFTSAWEHVWMLTRSGRYYFDQEAVAEPSEYPSDNRKTRSATTQKRMPSELIAGVRPESATYPTRNRRNVLVLPPEPLSESHFAAYPSSLPRILLAASTSAAGCCPRCRAPWRRRVERARGPVPEDRGGKNYGLNAQGTSPSSALRKRGGDDWYAYAGASRTTGFAPACSCAAGPPVPCRVLDPFVGSGTSLLVARELGLEGYGIELNAEYVEIAARRIDTWIKQTDTADARGQAGMFEVPA